MELFNKALALNRVGLLVSIEKKLILILFCAFSTILRLNAQTSSGQSGVIFGTGEDQKMLVVGNDFGMNGYMEFQVDQSNQTQDINFGFIDHSSNPQNPQFIERLRVTQTGNLGIGTSDPTKKLEVHGDALITSEQDWGSSQEATLFLGDGQHYIKVRPDHGLFLSTYDQYPGASDGNANDALHIQIETGNVGIGLGFDSTGTDYGPKEKLDIAGAIRIDDAYGYIENGQQKYYEGTLRYDSTTKKFQGHDHNNWVDLGHGAQGQWSVVGNYIKHDGSVYVGSGDPNSVNSNYSSSYKLWVEQGIVSEDFAISSINSWQDHVFDDDYELASLDEVEDHIKKQGHLPGIPSEEEVKEKGYTVHDMNQRFLQKIEELMLYTIDQERRIETLLDRIEVLERDKSDK